tara:strand:- start:669 stop:1190 length:522 start_codon:yes stop_codon:yes gene_type:complete
MDDANQSRDGQLIKAKRVTSVATRSHRSSTEDMNKGNNSPDREAIRALANEMRKQNVIILLMMRIKMAPMLIPDDVLMTLHWTTFATAMTALARWDGMKTIDQPAQEALCTALDGFSALAVKGSMEELALEYGDASQFVLSHEMREALNSIKLPSSFSFDDPFGGDRGPWDRN